MWAKNYDRCVSCGATDFPHAGKGYCKRCYHRINKELRISRIEINRKIGKTQKEKHASKVDIKSQLTSDVLRDLYFLKNMSFGDISRQYNCSRAYILKLCRLYNIPVRDKFKARSLAAKKGKLFFDYHKVNEQFFKAWSEKMAYVLGLLYADGHMPQNKLSFSLSLKEENFLRRVRDILESTHPIKKSKVQELYGLSIGSTKMAKDLLKLGFIPRKSLKIRFPSMPDTYVSHFIRGYFDGDGSIAKISKGGAYRVFIVTGSESFIRSMKDNLEKSAGVSVKVVKKRKTANAYDIYYHRRSDIEKLYEYFYDEYTRSNGLYLPRKFLKFQEAINGYKNWTLRQVRTSRRFDREETTPRQGKVG